MCCENDEDITRKNYLTKLNIILESLETDKLIYYFYYIMEYEKE